MFGLELSEVLILVAIFLFFFGPQRLPQFIKSMEENVKNSKKNI